MKTYSMKIFGFVASVAAAVLMVASCGPELGPDQQGGGQVDEAYESFVDSLENALYRQARAMQVVLTPSEEPVLVSSCEQKEDVENMYVITLSTGAAFPIIVDEDETYADAMTYVESDGGRCWALCDKEGNVAALENAEGAEIELVTPVDVKVADKKIGLKVGEATYDTGYGVEDKVQMFDCSLLADDSGTVYAVRFDFGEGKTKDVYVAEYSGLYYYLPSDQTRTAVDQMYVNEAGRATLAVNIPAEIAWQPVVDEGWTAVLRKEGDISYVDITAPAQYEVTEESQPQLKAMSSDGAFAFATVNLTDKKYRTFAISVTDAVIAPTTGLGKFAYGISLLSDFDQQDILDVALGLIAGNLEPSTGNDVSETAVSKSFADILGAALDSEERYVLWAFADGELRLMEFGEIAVDIEVASTSLLDAQIDVTVSGAEKIYGGVIEKTEDMKEIILYQVTNQIYDPVAAENQKFVYAGAASDFPVADAEKYGFMPDSEYVIWVVPAVDGDYEYTEKDMVLKEFKTNAVTPGGSLEITCGEPTVTPSSISFPISCEGAEMIYYAYLTEDGGNIFSDAQVPDQYKFEQMISEDSDYLVKKGAVLGDGLEAFATNLNDEAATTYWLFAAAVDSEGRYGKVHCVSTQTLALSYDTSITLSVSADNADITSNSVKFKVTSAGGDLSDYIYWVGKTTDPFWVNKCERYRGGAKKYMALNPEDEDIVKVMNKYGRLAEDGTITISGLMMSTKYVFVILEKGDVYYSAEGYKQVTTLDVDLGTIVREGTDKWNEAKSKIEIEWHKDKFEQPPHLMARYAFDFKCPTDLTAYIMCAGDGYYEEVGYTKMEQFMIDIETYTSRRIDKDHVPYKDGEAMSEPDYYKGGVYTEGQLMSVNDFYVHGSPLFGAVTFFAANSHGPDNCTSWKDGKCENYERALSYIEYYRSVEPYQNRAKGFGLEGKEAEDWALALQEAYSFYYADAEPLLYINDGSPLYVVNADATGVNDDGVVKDRVYVMFKDLQGNYYEPIVIEVPNYFEEK